MGSKFFHATATGPGATFALAEAIRTGFIDTQVGWTLFDNVSSVAGSSKRIFKSPATAIRTFYIEVSERTTLGLLRFRCWTDWDPSTHTGALGTFDDGGNTTAAISGGVVAQDATFTYDLAFHDNGFVCCSHIPSLDSPSIACLLDNTASVPVHMSGVAVLASDIIAGATSFPTTQSMVGKIFVGQDLIINCITGDSTDTRFGKKEHLKVTAVSASALTVTATANAYKAGSIAGFDPMPIATSVQLSTSGLREGLVGESPPNALSALFSYRMDGTGPLQDTSRWWSYCFDDDAAGGSDLWGKTYRLGNLPVFQCGRLRGELLLPAGFEASRGRAPPIAGHFRGTTQVLGDRIQVGTDNWFKVVVGFGAGGTGWADIGLIFGPRPSAEVPAGTTDWQGAFADDPTGFGMLAGGKGLSNAFNGGFD